MKLRKTILAAALALSVAALSACSSENKNSADNAETKGLQVIRVANMTGQPDQYAGYIGTEQGIFEKYGIKLETTEFAWGIGTIDAVVTGTADIGQLADFAAVNRFGNTLHDTNLTIFSDLSAGGSNNGGIYVAPKYADDLSSLENSEGWITSIGTVVEYYNWQAQKYLGLDPEKQKIVQSDSNLTSIALAQNGGASAVVATGAQGDRYAEQGWKLVADSKDVGINVYAYLVSTNEYVDNNSELLANYLRALKESYDYISNNLDEAAKKSAAKFGIDEQDFKSNWLQLNLRSGISEDGAAHLGEIKDWAFENGKFPEDYDVKQFYNDKAAKIAFPEETDIDLSGVVKE